MSGEQYYNEWTPLRVFSDGDEVRHIGDYFVCVYSNHESVAVNQWSYMVQLPETGRIIYPGLPGNRKVWDTKAEPKAAVNAWGQAQINELAKLDR